MEAIGVAIALLGQLIAFVVRIYPNGRLNGLIPRVVWIANFLAIVAGFAKQLVDAIGPMIPAATSGPVMAVAWGGLALLVKGGLAAVGAAALGALQRYVWEQFGRHVVPADVLAGGKVEPRAPISGDHNADLVP